MKQRQQQRQRQSPPLQMPSVTDLCLQRSNPELPVFSESLNQITQEPDGLRLFGLCQYSPPRGTPFVWRRLGFQEDWWAEISHPCNGPAQPAAVFQQVFKHSQVTRRSFPHLGSNHGFKGSRFHRPLRLDTEPNICSRPAVHHGEPCSRLQTSCSVFSLLVELWIQQRFQLQGGLSCRLKPQIYPVSGLSLPQNFSILLRLKVYII